eukprot:4154869-Pleurochrysis_carterae.AAC.1
MDTLGKAKEHVAQNGRDAMEIDEHSAGRVKGRDVELPSARCRQAFAMNSSRTTRGLNSKQTRLQLEKK